LTTNQEAGEEQMSALKRLAFAVGFVLGLAAFVLVVGNVLLYLLTGRLPSVEIKDDGKPVFGLVSPQEVVNLVKEQVEKERGRLQSQQSEGKQPL
jgi:hypothetical protein